jgi:hypothetical protein
VADRRDLSLSIVARPHFKYPTREQPNEVHLVFLLAPSGNKPYMSFLRRHRKAPSENDGGQMEPIDQELPDPTDPGSDAEAAEEQAAADEAARIGGRAGDEDLPPDERPVIEAGGGVAEGFELAEGELIERAEQGEGGYSGTEAFADASEDGRAGAAYGEPDEIESSELTSDPREGPDDPGAGPGAER